MVFYKVIWLISYVQLISQSLFPSDTNFWKTSNFSRFASILAFFARIVPEGSSENILQIMIICIFFSMMIFSIICVWFFFSYSNPLFRNSHQPSIFMIPVGLSKLILIPSFSLLFHECNYFTNVPSTPEFILSAISAFCCLILSYIFAVIGSVVPYFSGIGNLSWITKDFIFEIGYIIIIILESEFLAIIKSHTVRIVLLFGYIFFHLYITIYDITTNIKSRLFSFFSDITNISLLLTNILFFVREFRPIDSGTFLLYYIFTLVLSYSTIIFLRNIYKSFIYDIAKSYLCDRDYTKILKFPRRMIMVILCAIYPNIGNDWEYFDLIVTHFSHDYQFLFFYAKFLVLHPNEKLRIRKAIKDMKKVQGLDFVFSLQTRFVQLLLIQFDLDNELSIASRSKFSKNEVINYFSSLRMFWTEILLAKPNKLVTLTVNASNYFLDVVHNYAMNGIELEQFKLLENVCIINKSRLLNEKSKTPIKILSENRFFNTNQVINKLKEAENQIPNISRDTFESKSVSDIILTWQHFSFYIPFYFALFAIVFFGTYQLYSNSHFWHYFNFFQLLVNVTNYFAGSEGMIPYIVAVESGIVNSSGVVNYVIHDDFYQSSLLDPRQDAIHNAEIINSLFDDLKESLLTFFNGSVINNLSKAQVCLEQIGLSVHSLSFIPCMEVTRVKIESLINLKIDDLQKLMASEESKTIFYSTLKLLSFMSSYAFNMTDWIPPLLDEREVRISKSLMVIIYFVAFLSFVMCIVSIFFLMRGYKHYFEILISIPKNEISNLISKIGSSSSNYSEYQADVRYNINLLSYKSPPSSFHSNSSISIFLVIVDFVLILSAAIFINPLKNSLLSCIRGAFDNMNQMKLETIVVPYCFKMYYSLNEVIYLYKTNQTRNDNYQFFLNILKETADEAYAQMNPYMTNSQPKVIKNFFQRPLVNGYTIQNTFQIMSMILYDFYSELSHGNSPSHLDLVIGSVFRFMDNAIPRLLDETNDALIKMRLYNNKMKAYRFFIFLSILVFIFVIVDVILRPFKNGSVLFSVPLSTISLSEPEIEPSLTNENELLDSEAIFPKLGHYLLLVDKNNMIIKATDDAILFFDIEPYTITIDDFVARIEKYPSDHVFPPKEIDQLDDPLETVQQQNHHQQSQQQQNQVQVDLDQINENEPVAVFIDIDSCVPSVDSANGQDVLLRFMFIKTNLDDSSYAVVIDDITIMQTQISVVNEEANKVRMLIYQIIPWPLALTILSDDEYIPRIHGSLAIATFFIENVDLDENIRIHDYLRESLYDYPNLTFFGRSVTFFRMATPLFDRNLSVAQHTEYLIRFCNNIVKKIKLDATLYSQPKIQKNALNQQSINIINASCSICNAASIGSLILQNGINDNYSQNEFIEPTTHCQPNYSIENFPPFPAFLKATNDNLGHIRRNGSSSTVSSTNKRGNISRSNSCDITVNPLAKGNMKIEKKEQLKVRCSIDINGPYKSVLPDIQNLPPYFSIYSKNEDVGLFIAMNSRPNRVNVSQSVYESLYGIFKFDFENEIFTLDGKSIMIYTLVDGPELQ